MPKYRVVVKFKRLNTKGKLETSERSSAFESRNKNTAKEEYMLRLHKNEPWCQDILSVKVKKVR